MGRMANPRPKPQWPGGWARHREGPSRGPLLPRLNPIQTPNTKPNPTRARHWPRARVADARAHVVPHNANTAPHRAQSRGARAAVWILGSCSSQVRVLHARFVHTPRHRSLRPSLRKPRGRRQTCSYGDSSSRFHNPLRSSFCDPNISHMSGRH